MTTLTQLLEITGHPVTKRAWDERIDNRCYEAIIDRFDDCWGGLIDFERSDWVNLCEPYTSDLLARWQNDERDVMEMWVSYCEAIGATSSIQALEGECDRWADGDDMNCAIVNHSMTWAAGELLRHLTAWADEHTDHEGPIWDELRRHM